MTNIQTFCQQLSDWLATRPLETYFSLPKNTLDFCYERLKTLTQTQTIQQKFDEELGTRAWRPLGRILIVVSEEDIIGTLYALIGTLLTGNKALIKARTSENFLKDFCRSLNLDSANWQIKSWQSNQQNDEEILKNIDGVLLAGGNQLIQHYRKITPPGIRLIEYGQKISVAALANITENNIQQITQEVIKQTMLFHQNVCSSPQFIWVETKATCLKLIKELKLQLSKSVPLPKHTHLSQYQHLELIKCQLALGYFDEIGQCPTSKWLYSLNASNSVKDIHANHCFRFIYGELNQSFEYLNQLFSHQLQTIGIYQLNAQVFTPWFDRICQLSEIHCRHLNDSHDGMLELPQFVNFINIH